MTDTVEEFDESFNVMPEFPDGRDVLTGKVTTFSVEGYDFIPASMAYAIISGLMWELTDRGDRLNIPNTSDECIEIWRTEADTLLKFVQTNFDFEMTIMAVNMVMTGHKLSLIANKSMPVFKSLVEKHGHMIGTGKTLREAMPSAFSEYADLSAHKFIDTIVAVEHSFASKPWPGKHKNVMNWVELVNGKAVGWNEGRTGWSFPVITYSSNNA